MEMNQYLDLFLEESAEHLQNFNEGLLSLEHNPERLDLLEEIFRAAHTLKGMSATMGYESIAQLTHEMENLLDQLQKRKLQLSPALINTLFEGVDAIEEMLKDIRAGGAPRLDPSSIMAKLDSLGNGGGLVLQEPEVQGNPKIQQAGLQDYNEYEQRIFQAARDKGLRSWRMVISLDKGCVMKSARAFMVFRNLEGLGEVVKAIPSVQDIEDEKFENTFVLVLVSAKGEQDIRGAIESISEVRLAEINEVEEQEIAVGTSESIDPEKGKALTEKDETLPQHKETARKIHQTVRVDISRLDKLMSLVGELVINKTRLEQISQANRLGGLNETIEQINRITTDLQTVVQNVRMVPIEQVFNRFPRMVRDLARELGKEVELILEGKETELDRTVIDEIGDPLVHLIRNALDHGLESPRERQALQKRAEGTLKLAARQEGNHVLILIEDDGRGINLASIEAKALEKGLYTAAQLESMDEQALLDVLFEPGFSTAREITDISGRGVGLDVVKSKIQNLSGHVYVETKMGQGTRFIIKLPLTLAIIQALMVKVQEETYAIPLGNIDETTNLESQQIKNVQGQQVMLLRGKVLPLLFVKDLLDVPGDLEQVERYVVVVRKGEQQVGLVVDEMLGQQEIVINTLGKLLAGLPGIAGASILGDGRVSLILDIGTLF